MPPIAPPLFFNQNIQIYRGLAIIFVFLHHLSLTPLVLSRINPAFSMPFWVGVELFFMISGYVIGSTAIYGARVSSASNFLIRRVFRIYPNLIFFFLFTALINLYLLSLPFSNWGRTNLAVSWDTFLREFLHISTATLDLSVNRSYQNTVLWSLVVELQFYFAIFILLLIFKKLPTEFVKKFLLKVSFTLVFIMIITRILRYFNDFEVFSFFNYMLSNKFDFLLAGFCIAGMRNPVKKQVKIPPTVILILVILAIGSSEPIYPANSGRVLNSFTLVFVMCCFIFLLFCATHESYIRRRNTLIRRFFSHIGDLSYSIFLYQFPVFAVFWLMINRFFPQVFSSNNGWTFSILQLLFCAPATYWVSKFSYQRIEVRFISIGKNSF